MPNIIYIHICYNQKLPHKCIAHNLKKKRNLQNLKEKYQNYRKPKILESTTPNEFPSLCLLILLIYAHTVSLKLILSPKKCLISFKIHLQFLLTKESTLSVSLSLFPTLSLCYTFCLYFLLLNINIVIILNINVKKNATTTTTGCQWIY